MISINEIKSGKYMSLGKIGNYKVPVSVVIPTYNRPKLLIRAINSVVKQTHPGPFEIVVVDDSEMVFPECEFTKYCTEKIAIKYIKNRVRLGAPLSRNVGIANCTSEFIAFLDDDDEWLPDKITKQVEQFNKNSKISLSVCYSEDRRFSRVRISRPIAIVTHKSLIKSFNLSSTSSYLTRKTLLDKIKDKNGYYFDPSLKSGQEYDLAIRLSKFYDIMTVQEILMIQHSEAGQISGNWSRKISGIISLYSKYHDEYTLVDHIKTIGILVLFAFGFLVGDKIYKVIIPIKEKYEKTKDKI